VGQPHPYHAILAWLSPRIARRPKGADIGTLSEHRAGSRTGGRELVTAVHVRLKAYPGDVLSNRKTLARPYGNGNCVCLATLSYVWTRWAVVNLEEKMEDQKEQDRIRRRAYELWERQGSPEGRAEEFWELAKTSLAEETSEISTDEKTAGTDPGRDAQAGR
jgi:Protein of unknown function (DUF2934)